MSSANPDLIRVVYISRANFTVASAETGVEPTVARILQASRINNPKLAIGGLLYYGDGCFFQCLEGERSVVVELLKKIKRDPRHKDMKVVYQVSTQVRQYSNWSMKYIPASDRVQSLLAHNGHKRFDPYQFDKEMVKKLLQAFRLINHERDHADEPGSLEAEGASPADQRKALVKWLAAPVVLGLLAGLVWYGYA
ncbi:BLUF domain-containing protein [Marinimicrobium alkaliphilum]|uniref:BLUF domain-containing protein n=1 Tax=Marinimicrobium alkaliphilum TaxID=2202654 RepID=UPI000DBAAE6F|nr:BLUF domain-containing protein [Marinimicrobium alkaliphilum]